MARKKVVLFIVEGITDQESLELLLEEFIQDNNQVIFEVVDGDITSSNDVDKKNIKGKITEIIKDGGKSSLMREIGERALQEGYSLEYHHCSSDPTSIDDVVIVELGVGIIDGTPPHGKVS